MFELKKIGVIKRFSALLLDAILLAVLSTGFMFVISLICNYSGQEAKAIDYYNQWDEFRKDYIPEVAEHYGFTYEESEDGASYTITKVDENGDVKSASLDEVVNALATDEHKSDRMEEIFATYQKLPTILAVNTQYEYLYSMLFTIVSVGILLAYLVLEFIVPIILKNGQTVGKKVFNICLVKPNCVKITNISLFARTLIGKYAIETMFPILLVFLFLFGGIGVLAIILLAAITLLNVILFIATKNNTPIHDVIAVTVAADKSLQMIFESEEDLAEKKANYKGFI